MEIRRIEEGLIKKLLGDIDIKVEREEVESREILHIDYSGAYSVD